MKPISTIMALLLALPVSLLFAADTSILLIDNARTTVGDTISGLGSAKAIIKGTGGETRVTADAITFQESSNSLICVGASSIAFGDRTVKGKDITIELGGSPVRLFVLTSDRIILLGEQSGFESFPAGTQRIPAFNEQLPTTNLDLRSGPRR